MSDLLTLGASGLRAYARALGVVGDNVANAETPGYVRRTARVAEAPPGGSSALVKSTRPGGALFEGVGRVSNQWLVENSRAAASDAGRTAARLPWLYAAERALGNGGDSVGGAITGLFNRADELAGDPASTARRQAFLNAVDAVASRFRATAGELASAATGAGDAATSAVSGLNANIAALQRVNQDLYRARGAARAHRRHLSAGGHQ